MWDLTLFFQSAADETDMSSPSAPTTVSSPSSSTTITTTPSQFLPSSPSTASLSSTPSSIPSATSLLTGTLRGSSSLSWASRSQGWLHSWISCGDQGETYLRYIWIWICSRSQGILVKVNDMNIQSDIPPSHCFIEVPDCPSLAIDPEDDSKNHPFPIYLMRKG